jgi:hypothetical protein
MKKYKVVAVLWDDHMEVNRSTLSKNPDERIRPVLSIGIVLDETEKVLVLGSCIERYETYDDVSYMLILKATIVSIKEFGTIKIAKPRRE